jgi:aminoglycoside phosphotransferase (APT) family kinase protein
LETLAKLHQVDFKAIGLESYGRNSGFYERQMKSLHRVSSLQASVMDKETGEKVQELPRLDEMFAWFKKNQPKDKATIVHGDFKVRRNGRILRQTVYIDLIVRLLGVLD